MAFSNSGSLIRNTGHLLRRRRKHLVPYKGKWQQNFNQQQAMEALKTAVAAEQDQVDKKIPTTTAAIPPLLSTLINSFSIYACDPTPAAYALIIKTLTHNSQFHHLPLVLQHIQNANKFDPPEELFSYLIRNYGYANRIHDAVDLLFNIPNFRCTPSALSLNALLSVLCKTKQGLQMVHDVLLRSQAINIRLEESTFRILITSLCKINKIGYAIEMLNLMDEFGYDPDPTLYSLILSAMCKIRSLSSVEVLGFFDELRQKGFSPSEMDYTNVIGFLVKEGKGMDALNLLNQMKLDGIKPDVVVYTSILHGLVAADEFQKTEQLFDEMLVLGVVPNVYTYNVYLKSLCLQNMFEPGFKLIECMEELGCKPTVSTYNTLMRALCNVGKVRRVKEEVLRMMRLKGIQWNLHTYSILIDGLMHEAELEDACKLFEDMLSKGYVPKPSTCNALISQICKQELISEAVEMVKLIVGRGIPPGVSA